MKLIGVFDSGQSQEQHADFLTGLIGRLHTSGLIDSSFDLIEKFVQSGGIALLPLEDIAEFIKIPNANEALLALSAAPTQSSTPASATQFKASKRLTYRLARNPRLVEVVFEYLNDESRAKRIIHLLETLALSRFKLMLYDDYTIEKQTEHSMTGFELFIRLLKEANHIANIPGRHLGVEFLNDLAKAGDSGTFVAEKEVQFKNWIPKLHLLDRETRLRALNLVNGFEIMRKLQVAGDLDIVKGLLEKIRSSQPIYLKEDLSDKSWLYSFHELVDSGLFGWISVLYEDSRETSSLIEREISMVRLGKVFGRHTREMQRVLKSLFHPDRSPVFHKLESFSEGKRLEIWGSLAEIGGKLIEVSGIELISRSLTAGADLLESGIIIDRLEEMPGQVGRASAFAGFSRKFPDSANQLFLAAISPSSTAPEIPRALFVFERMDDLYGSLDAEIKTFRRSIFRLNLAYSSDSWESLQFVRVKQFLWKNAVANGLPVLFLHREFQGMFGKVLGRLVSEGALDGVREYLDVLIGEQELQQYVRKMYRNSSFRLK
jgi:hypothetical protein